MTDETEPQETGETMEEGNELQVAKESDDAPTAQEEAQVLMDSISDKPEVCKALYDMLQEKYEGEEEPTTKPAPYRGKVPAKSTDKEVE